METAKSKGRSLLFVYTRRHGMQTAGRQREEALLKSPRRSLADIPRKQDAISLLCADHETLLNLFDELQQVPRDTALANTRTLLTVKITQLLKLHLEIENTIFYPAATVSRVSESVEIESSFEQDDEQYVIEELEALSITDARYDEKVARLSEQLRDHVLEEETEIFPRFKAANVDMLALGVKIRCRQRGLG